MDRFELKSGYQSASVPVVDGRLITLTEGEPYDTDDQREQLALREAECVKYSGKTPEAKGSGDKTPSTQDTNTGGSTGDDAESTQTPEGSK